MWCSNFSCHIPASKTQKWINFRLMLKNLFKTMLPEIMWDFRKITKFYCFCCKIPYNGLWCLKDILLPKKNSGCGRQHWLFAHLWFSVDIFVFFWMLYFLLLTVIKCFLYYESLKYFSMIMLFSLQTSFAEVTDSVPCKTITAIGLEML